MTDEQKKLAEENMRLAYYVAKKYLKGEKHYEADELYSLALFGLCKAAKTFKIELGNTFATYASRCMHNEILMFLRRNKNAKLNLQFSTSLNIDNDGNELVIEDLISNLDHLKYDEVLDLLRAKDAIKILKPRELEILQQRYFFNQTQKIVADRLKLSQSYISRLEKRILKKLYAEDRREVS